MSIASDLIRGNTDMIILARLLKKESYGYEINKHIQEISGGSYELKEATLYGCFRRLESMGYINSYWGDETTGARRRYYSITPSGKQAFDSYKTEWQSAKDLIDRLTSQDMEDNYNA